MNSKEESSFLQSVESRLDSLFGEDSGALKEKQPVPPTEVANAVAVDAEVASEPKEDIREVPVVKEPSLPTDAPSDNGSIQDKSTFISEIEKRFSAIFGEEDKDASTVNVTEKRVEAPVDPLLEPSLDASVEASIKSPVASPAVLPIVPAPLEQEISKDIDQDAGEIAAPVSSIYNSPLKDMKSIVLSLEWEISDPILGQFEDEVNKLYLLYTGNRIVQGFLRILRFLGRYIRVRGISSNQDSINLLLSVYDHLESVMISEGMTEARKHIILLDNIKKYRSWVENTDIETGAGHELQKPMIEEAVPSGLPVLETRTVEELPEAGPMEAFAEKAQEQAIVEEIHLKEPLSLGLSREEETPYVPKETDVVIQARSMEMVEALSPILGDQTQKTMMETMKNLPPHEAFAYAVEEIKKSFQTQLDALKEEIRILKNAR